MYRAQDKADYFEKLHSYKYSISSSQLAKIMGISKHGSRTAFYKEKMGIAKPPRTDNSYHAQFGTDQEPISAQRFKEKFLDESNTCFIEYVGTKVCYDSGLPAPFYLCASPDREVIEKDTGVHWGLEIKNRTPDAKERLPAKPLVDHYLQVLQTMKCWEYPFMIIGYFVNEDQAQRCFYVPWNQEAWDYCEGFLKNWCNHITTNTDPGPMKKGEKEEITTMIQGFIDETVVPWP